MKFFTKQYNIFNNKKKLAFTLIELLIVIAIIGVLATLAIVALQNSRANARDSKRLADIKQMQIALELYFNDNKSYPTSVTSTIATGSTIYMEMVPTAPTPADGSCTAENNGYTYSSDGSTYSIFFCLGSRVGGTDAGQKEASASGIANITPPAPWACGDTLTDSRDSQQYPTVLIGTQCWMAKNLAYLPAVHSNSQFQTQGSSALPAYGVYGYNGTDVNVAKALANYINYGVLYNWYAAVATSSTTGTEGVQGACPTGWHVPTSAQLVILETYLGGASVAGGKLKQTGTTNWLAPNSGATNESGFNALSSGRRDYSTGFSYDIGYNMYMWSSSFSYPKSINCYLSSGNANVVNYSSAPATGFSVRCLKN